jgi:hypothetical protein
VNKKLKFPQVSDSPKGESETLQYLGLRYWIGLYLVLNSSQKGMAMDTILAAKTTSISEFKSNPAAALKNAGDEPFAVLTNNKPSFYVVQPELYK